MTREVVAQVITTSEKHTLITGEGNTTLITAGHKGVAGKDSATSEDAIRELVSEVIHADATDDGLYVDHLGNLRISIGSLPKL